MKIKNQTSMPGKYWLIILAVICVGLLGSRVFRTAADLCGLWPIIRLFPCRRESAMPEDI